MQPEKNIGQMYRPIVEILTDFKKPVDPSLISTRPSFEKGERGKDIQYIHWYDLVAVLEEICPGWEWEIRTQFIPDRVIVEGRLTINAKEGKFIREATGDEPLETKAYGGPVSAAEASALRRCMAKFSYGLELWRKDKGKVEVGSKKRFVEQLSDKPITDKQLKYLWAVAKNDSGLADKDIDLIIARYGYQSTKDISQKHFDSILEEVKQAAKYLTYQQRRELVNFCKQENIASETVTRILNGCGYKDSSKILRGQLEEMKQLILEQSSQAA